MWRFISDFYFCKKRTTMYFLNSASDGAEWHAPSVLTVWTMWIQNCVQITEEMHKSEQFKEQPRAQMYASALLSDNVLYIYSCMFRTERKTKPRVWVHKMLHRQEVLGNPTPLLRELLSLKLVWVNISLMISRPSSKRSSVNELQTTHQGQNPLGPVSTTLSF